MFRTGGGSNSGQTYNNPTFTGVALFANGSKTAPSISYTSDPDTGFYARASDVITAASGGIESFQVGTSFGSFIGGIRFASGDLSTTTTDAGIRRFAANIIGVRDENSVNTANEFRVYAGNGCYHSVTTVNESLTIAAAATTDTAFQVPAGAILLAAPVRVTTVIPTAATFTVTTAVGGTTLSTAAVNVAANSTDKGTAAGASYRSAATSIRITPNLTPGTATGVVRVCAIYFNPNPPTS